MQKLTTFLGAVAAAHQGLIAPDASFGEIDDRLEGHGEIDGKRAASAAAVAGGGGRHEQMGPGGK